MSGLTRRQLQLLEFIDRRTREDGVSPSFDEMRKAVGLASKSGIHRLVTALEERGFIRRLPHRARALKVVHMPGRGSIEHQLERWKNIADFREQIAESQKIEISRLRETNRRLGMRLSNSGLAV